MQHQQLKALLEKFNDGTISDEELQALNAWYASLDAVQDSELYNPTHQTAADLTQQRLQELKTRISGEATPMFPVKGIFPIAWIRRIAVAVTGIALISVSYLIFNSNKSIKPVITLQQKPGAKQDVAPGTSTPVLTLADGSTISLDSIGNGSLGLRQKNNLLKSGTGELTYSDERFAGKVLEYNTLFVPKGSKMVHLTLSDGTQVWLNSFSSLRYPVTFSGKERRVEITGEAYFEVAKNEQLPFIVQREEIEVKVLGTHFNVNSYADENNIKITLLEGAIKINNASTSKLLRPGDQAALNGNGGIAVNADVDLDEVIAWKNGRFEFNGQTIDQIMRQVERWYDVKVEYKGKIADDHFVGDVSRMENVSEVLKMLAHTGVINFTIENKTIIVSGK